ncbi:intradiol ring-cleavage dioxygenase [Streptomyces sp. NPDC059072]|uniref:dioxygenase family protein n=1 Tax=Streptomyces sp. NPDC059072 TaxID=3346715 RepID=UPI0036CF9949
MPEDEAGTAAGTAAGTDTETEAGKNTSRAGRRAVLLAAGSAGAAALITACGRQVGTGGAAGLPSRPPVGTGTPACVLATEAGAGPYYMDLDRVRSDITEGRGGVPLRLDLTVVKASEGCRPLEGARFDVWHADSSGDYSTGKATFLRGTQLTDAAGRCVFRTIVPGWYAGLAPHIHFKVHPDARTETTSQFFFPEDVLLQVYARRPYARRPAPKHPNSRDSRYRAAGATMTLPLAPDGDGYRAAFTVGIA